MKKIAVSILTVLLSVAFAMAQTTSGRLTGTVSGPDGVLPNATVTAKDNVTGKTQTVTTNGEGIFSFPQLEFGTYTVTVTAQGFKTYQANEVKINVGREFNLDPLLELGNVQESVTVTAGEDVVTSTSAQVSNTVSTQQILSLPLVTRNPLNLTSLQAGVTNAANTAQNTSINGLRTSFTNITRDGINVNDPFIRANATDFTPARPSVDDVSEFTVTTTNQEADQGMGGAQIRLVTPRGTKDFHGALFAFNRNSAFGANNFFNKRTVSATQPKGIPKTFRNRNQYGGKVSGPLPIPRFGEGGPGFYKDKGYFFFAYEGIKDPNSAAFTRQILTPSARNGIFTFNRASPGNPINAGGISCPSGDANSVCTVTDILAFGKANGIGNLPAATDPLVVSKVLSQIPTTSNFTGGDGLNTAGYRLLREQSQFRDVYSSRVDVDFNEKSSMHGVFNYNKESNLRPDADTTKFTTKPGVIQYSINKQFSLAYRQSFTPTFVNDLRGGVFTSEVPFNRTDDTPSYFVNNAAANGLSLVAGLVSTPDNTFLSQGRNTKIWNLQDNVDWIVGNHSFKFGGQLQYFQVNSYNDVGIVPFYRLGTGSASGQLTASQFANVCAGACPSGSTSIINNNQLGTANSLLALLGGIVNTGLRQFNVRDLSSGFEPVRRFQPFRHSNHSLYFSDRWLAAKGLTVTLGVRYELFPAIKLASGLGLEPVLADPSNFIPSLLNSNGTFNLVGGNAGKEGQYFKTDYNNFAPNVGFAYTPNFESGIGKFLFGSAGKSVIRAGYSHIYSNDQALTAVNAALNSNVGLGLTTSNAVRAGTSSTVLNDRLSGTLTSIPTPPPPVLPRTYLQNNAPAVGGNVGNVSAVDPNLKTPMVQQYSFGFQREFFGNTAIEIRYVGSRSKNLIRATDFNQIDIFSNGFLSDFERARANLALTGNPFCTSAGCQTLSIFRESAGGAGRLGVAPSTASTPTGTLARATFVNNLTAGTPADLARTYIANDLNGHPTAASPGLTPFIRLVPNPAAGTTDIVINDAYHNYNSLQFEVRRRLSRDLQFQANYTFAKNLTNAPGTAQALFDTYIDNNRKELDNQRANFDQTHAFNLNAIYRLPFGKGKMFLDQGGIVDKIFGGWELAGVTQWSSGIPISIVDTRGTFNRTGRSGQQTATSSLSSTEIRALGGIYEANGNVYFINPAILKSSGEAGVFGSTHTGQVFFANNPGQTGNMYRNYINGPKFFNINMSVLKNIRFTETMKVQFRAEAFNLLNNVNFNITGAQQIQNITSTTFGRLTGTSTAVTPSGAREIQFGIRFEF